MNKGLQDFLNDEKLMSELKPTPKEIEALKKGTLTFTPTKDFYIGLLFDYRKIVKKNKK